MVDLRTRLEDLLDHGEVTPANVLVVVGKHYEDWLNENGGGPKSKTIVRGLYSMANYITGDVLPRLQYNIEHLDGSGHGKITVTPEKNSIEVRLRAQTHEALVHLEYNDDSLLGIIDRPSEEYDCDGQFRARENGTVVESIINRKTMKLP